MQAVSDFVPNERRRRDQAFHAALAFFLASVHHDQHSRRPPVVAISTAVTVAKPNARISQFTFDDGFNLFPQGLAQALPMVFGCPRFSTPSPRNKTNENIRN